MLTLMATIILIDPRNGFPLAIMDGTHITNMRTGAGGAVAAKYLSPRPLVSLGVVGSGRQARAQIEAIGRELEIQEVLVWSRSEKNATGLCTQLPHFECRSASLPRVCECDLLVTTTPSRAPLIRDEWIHEGMHINAIGADAPGKEELDPAILRRSRLFVDDPAQAVHSGEVNVPIRSGLFSEHMIAGTLGEVILSKKKRNNPGEITVFDSTGLAIQDLAIASLALESKEWIELKFP